MRPRTWEAFQEAEARWKPGDFRARQVAESAGQVVGVAEVYAFPYVPPDLLSLRLNVDPTWRGQGLGGSLLAWAEETAREAGAAGLSTNVRDDRPQDRAWAERRGFALHAHRFASTLDLTTFAIPASHLLPPGVTLGDMTEASEADWERLYAFTADRLSEPPDLAGQPRWPEARVREMIRESDRARPDWVLLAEREGALLGVAVLMDFGHFTYNEFTAVHPSARGLGLARALKLEVIARARAAGRSSMRTNNHTTNAPMLAVNQRLGFVPEVGQFELHRRWTP